MNDRVRFSDAVLVHTRLDSTNSNFKNNLWVESCTSVNFTPSRDLFGNFSIKPYSISRSPGDEWAQPPQRLMRAGHLFHTRGANVWSSFSGVRTKSGGIEKTPDRQLRTPPAELYSSGSLALWPGIALVQAGKTAAGTYRCDADDRQCFRRRIRTKCSPF
jgi:hypothetical protein